jgi:hypothetical protein
MERRWKRSLVVHPLGVVKEKTEIDPWIQAPSIRLDESKLRTRPSPRLRDALVRAVTDANKW